MRRRRPSCATARLGRIWRDREPDGLPRAVQPAAPQPDDGERAARAHPAAPPGRRGVQPRPRRAAAPAGARARWRQLLDAVDPDGFDVIGRLRRAAAGAGDRRAARRARADHAPSLRSWSQAIVRMYEPSPDAAVVDAAVVALRPTFADSRARARVGRRRSAAGRRPDQRPGRQTDLDRRRGRGRRRPAAQRRSRGVGQRLRQRPGRDAAARDLRPATDAALTVEEMLRFDSALQLFERTATAHVEVGGVVIEPGQKIAALLGAANRDPRSSPTPTPSTSAATPTPTWPSAPACTSAWARRWPGWSWPSR